MKRMRKKGVAEVDEDSPDAEATVTEDSGEAEDSGKSSSAPSSASVSRNGFPKHEKKAPLPRGKAGKAKRAAAKYADQDDEDRELAVALAAAAGRASKKGGKGKKNAQKKNRRGDDDSDDDDVFDPVKAKTAKTARRDANGVERRQPGSGAKATEIRKTNATEIGKTNATEIRKTNATAKDSDSDSEPASESEPESNSKFLALDAARVAKIDRLVFNPVAEDDVAFAVPIVAPYVALQSARYKVKLTPGTQKKGKAAKHASDVLLRAPSGARAAGVETDRATREADKALDERLKARMRAAEGAAGELAHIMCGSGVKVSVPAGVAKAINASRKNTGKGKGGNRGRGVWTSGVRAKRGRALLGRERLRGRTSRRGAARTSESARSGENSESARSGENARATSREVKTGGAREGSRARTMLDESSHVVCSHSSARAAPNTRKIPPVSESTDDE